MNAVQTITAEVARIRGVPVGDILSRRRSVLTVRPRQEVMYLARHLTSCSLPEIGRAIGGRDHTTVLHGIRTIEAKIATLVGYGDELETLQAVIAEALPSEIVADALANAEGRPTASQKAQASIEARIVGLAGEILKFAGGLEDLAETVAWLKAQTAARASDDRAYVNCQLEALAALIPVTPDQANPTAAFEERLLGVQTSLQRLEERIQAPRPITLQLPRGEAAARPAKSTAVAGPSPAVHPGSPALMTAVRQAVADFDRLENDRFSSSERSSQAALDRSLKTLKTKLQNSPRTERT